jgi:hypothetical protein
MLENPYRLDVYTTSVREVVAHAGGWLVDRTLGGWTVTIVTEASDDAPQAARILGCKIAVFAEAGDSPPTHAIASMSAIYGTDDAVRKRIDQALDRNAFEVSLIGARPHAHDRRLRPVTHRLSVAARAFKAQSMTALGLTTTAAATEQLLSAVAADAGADVRSSNG